MGLTIRVSPSAIQRRVSEARFHPNTVTLFHARNLSILADYLEKLPYDYESFRMSTYLISRRTTHSREGLSSALVRDLGPQDAAGILHECGTSACAVGHAPSAGIEPIPEDGDSWRHYEERVFGLTGLHSDYKISRNWQQMFGGTIPSDPKLVAALIREYIRQQIEFASAAEVPS